MFTGLSFIIPHRESEDINSTVTVIKRAFDRLNQLDEKYKKVEYEILTTTGNHPSLQRNQTALKAKYTHLYFIDNDAFVSVHSLKIIIHLLQQQSKENPIKVLGGPSVLPPKSNFWQKNVAATLSSKWVMGKVSDRYYYFESENQNNKTEDYLKSCDDSSLILCNLVVEKKCFNQHGGFDTKLYPNEENEFLYRLQQNQITLYYHPEVMVYRHQRERLKDYIKQMLTYGRGRGEQTRVNPKSIGLIHVGAMGFPLFVFFTLLFFVVYSFPFLSTLFSKSNTSIFSVNVWNVIDVLLTNFWILYFVGYVFLFMKISKRYKRVLILAPFLTFCCHFFYGTGIWRGLLSLSYKVKKKKTYFKIKKEKS